MIFNSLKFFNFNIDESLIKDDDVSEEDGDFDGEDESEIEEKNNKKSKTKNS